MAQIWHKEKGAKIAEVDRSYSNIDNFAFADSTAGPP
jgi:hypothetical protein